MKFLPTTNELVGLGEYFDSPSSFFKSFSPAYDSVRGQILKYEGRQEYRELENLSYNAFLDGSFSKAIELIRLSKKDDEPIYQRLSEAKVDIIRVRPIKVPRSEYLKWEIENYKVSAEYGEQIFFFHYNQLAELLVSNVHHDFMVFDSRFAFMHDYDQNNVLKGGWRYDDLESISKLLNLFSVIKANSVHFRLCV